MSYSTKNWTSILTRKTNFKTKSKNLKLKFSSKLIWTPKLIKTSKNWQSSKPTSKPLLKKSPIKEIIFNTKFYFVKGRLKNKPKSTKSSKLFTPAISKPSRKKSALSKHTQNVTKKLRPLSYCKNISSTLPKINILFKKIVCWKTKLSMSKA